MDRPILKTLQQVPIPDIQKFKFGWNFQIGKWELVDLARIAERPNNLWNNIL